MIRERWVVDRIEGGTAVLLAEPSDRPDRADSTDGTNGAVGEATDGSSLRSGSRVGPRDGPGERVVELPLSTLPAGVREGWVLVVPRSGNGPPRWVEAVRDEDEERRRLEEGRRILEELEERDEGGDIDL